VVPLLWTRYVPKSMIYGAEIINPTIEDWTYAPDGRMRKRQMSGNDMRISEAERWFVDGATDDDVDKVDITEKHW